MKNIFIMDVICLLWKVMTLSMLITGSVTMTTRRPLTCPESCVCLNGSMTLQCGNNFRSASMAFSSVTRNFILRRDFRAPLLNGTFNNLISVRTMDLSHSKINFIYSGAFRGLINLKEMNLRGNLIQFLDEYLFEESLQLEFLDLSQNNLRDIPMATFRFLPNLKMLNVSYNRLTSARLGVRFKVATILQVIDFSGNNIERISADDFAPAEKWDASVAKNVNFSSCNLKVIEPEAIESLGNIKNLGLRNNIHLEFENITAYLEAIRKVNLVSVDLSYTDLSYKVNMSEFSVDNLGPLSIQELYLAGNGFTDIDDQSLSCLNLKKLDLSHNHLSTIGDWTASMNNLVMLDMSHNAILTVSGSFVNCVLNMKTLKLSNNLITDYEKLNLSRAIYLEYLDLSYNKFLLFHIPRQLSKLRHIDLSNNLIQNINNGEVLAGLQDLVDFDVSINKLTTINAFIFRSSRHITRADFHGNLIASVSDRAFVPNSPKFLDLSHNELVAVQHFGWHGIIEVNLAHNRIADIESLAFFNQNKLKRLNLNGNLISMFDLELFKDMSNLTVLELKGNYLTETLQLPLLLAPLENLEIIDLSGNNFSHFHFVPSPFSSNYELKQIKLSNNNIKVLSPMGFSFLKNLEKLDFSRNPFDCGCDNLPLQRWLKTTSVTIEGKENLGYICQLPRMRGTQTLLKYSTKMFECDRYLFWVMVISSSGGSAILVAVVIAVVCFLVQRHRSKKLTVSDPQTVDLISHEKLEMNGTVKTNKHTHEDYLAELRSKYLHNRQSDTLVGVEFENPLMMNGHADIPLDRLDKNKRKSKKSGKSSKKTDKTKKRKKKPSKGKDDNKGVHFANGSCRHSEKVQKMLEYVDKEMKKNSKKKFDSKDMKSQEEHQRLRRRRSRDNRDLVRLVSSQGSRSMPDVVRYINSHPRYVDKYNNPYRKVPIYHVDHVNDRDRGWAHSLIDIPRRMPTRGGDHHARLYEDYRRERKKSANELPHGYHTIVGGRGRAIVDTRMMENKSAEGDKVLPNRSRSPKVRHTVATIHGTDIVERTEKQPNGQNHSQTDSLQLSQWL